MVVGATEKRAWATQPGGLKVFHRGLRPESEQGVPAVLGMDGDVWEPREEGGGGRRKSEERKGRVQAKGNEKC